MVAEYGSRLLCVRYHYDARRGRRSKTVELIVDENSWEPRRRKGCGIVRVRVGAFEREWQRKVRAAGGRWNPAARVWELRYDRAREVGAVGRIAEG